MVGGWGGGGASNSGYKLLAVSRGQVLVVNAALALHLHVQNATTAGQMVGQGRQQLQCCNGLQVQLLQERANVDGPEGAAWPLHAEAHLSGVAKIDLDDRHLQRGQQKNVFRRSTNNLIGRHSGDDLVVFSATKRNTAGTKT